MARKNNTLSDLSDFLNQNPNEIELGKVKSKEDFISRAPNNLVKVPKTEKKNVSSSDKSLEGVALLLHEKAEKENKSFTEVWLQVLEEGVKIDPLLKHTNAFKTMRSIRKTSVNVVLEGITQLIKRK
jgi:hypothetical protein